MVGEYQPFRDTSGDADWALTEWRSEPFRSFAELVRREVDRINPTRENFGPRYEERRVVAEIELCAHGLLIAHLVVACGEDRPQLYAEVFDCSDDGNELLDTSYDLDLPNVPFDRLADVPCVALESWDEDGSGCCALVFGRLNRPGAEFEFVDADGVATPLVPDADGWVIAWAARHVLVRPSPHRA